MAELVKLVPGVKWTTRREEAARFRPRPVPDETNSVIAILPPSYSDEPSDSYGRKGSKSPQKVSIPRRKYDEAVKRKAAIRIHRSAQKHRDFWVYKKKVYVTSDQALRPADVVALVNEAANARRLRLEKAHSLQAMTKELDTKGKRQSIPQDVKVAVWQRDGGRCVECASNQALEFDHIIPLSMGGANTMRNLQLLCDACNRRKGATLG